MQEQSDPNVHWAAAKAIFDMLDYGAFLCDGTAKLLVGNEAAIATLEERDGLRLKGGHVLVHDMQVRSQLRWLLLEKTVGKRSGAAAAIHAALLVPRPSASPSYHLILQKIVPEGAPFGAASGCLWGVIISNPRRAPMRTMRALSHLYELTPAETHVAALLIAGATPHEIAGQTRVKITTIRTQLRSLFAKTQTTRQTELVRLFSSVPRCG